MSCPTCSSTDLREMGAGNYWCRRCGTLVEGDLPGFNPAVEVPELIEEWQEWGQKELAPVVRDFHKMMRGLLD